jgi:uncharacterized RDD family membrane protein YckC
LAGWWSRLGAVIIDGLLQALIVGIVGFPVWRRVADEFVTLMEESVDAAEAGLPGPSQAEFTAAVAGSTLTLSLIGIAVSLVYYFTFLKWRAATPGKLALGLRVRLRDAPGPLSWATIGKRWIATNWATFFGWIPVLGSLLGLYTIIDGLWPLWDDKKQALHDKFAGTNVVKINS